MDSLEDVQTYFRLLELERFIEPHSFLAETDCRGFSFRVRPGVNLRQELLRRRDFRRGPLGFTHIRHVGFPVADFRSMTRAGAPFSLQINIGLRGYRVDLDRYNPDEGLDRFVLHVLREVLRLW